MFLINHRWNSILSWTTFLSCIAVFGWTVIPVGAHCAGNHTGDHPHCAGSTQRTPNAALIYAESTNIYVTNLSGSSSTLVFSGTSGFAAPSSTADAEGFLVSAPAV